MVDANITCGRACARFRREALNITQKQVAKELNYSQENISAFENGRNSNNLIFMWYIRNGLFNYCSINEVCGCNG